MQGHAVRSLYATVSCASSPIRSEPAAARFRSERGRFEVHGNGMDIVTGQPRPSSQARRYWVANLFQRPDVSTPGRRAPDERWPGAAVRFFPELARIFVRHNAGWHEGLKIQASPRSLYRYGQCLAGSARRITPLSLPSSWTVRRPVELPFHRPRNRDGNGYCHPAPAIQTSPFAPCSAKV
jgi:hypothetical protein